MSFLHFDRAVMANLKESLRREFMFTERGGGYCLTSLVGCNVRKYNGLLVTPPWPSDGERRVLLSCIDEDVIQHGAEFHLGLHKYQGDHYSPKGHKYIRSFSLGAGATTVYRVGGVVLEKTLVFRRDECRLLISYRLLEAHSATTLRIRPFLAFRSVREFTHKNYQANGTAAPEQNGVSFCMYSGFPRLYLQLNRKAEWRDAGAWWMGFDYSRERERGYEANEDLYVPGYFEIGLRKGETVVLSAGLEALSPRRISAVLKEELASAQPWDSFYNCLLNAAHQFEYVKDGEHYILAGHPWFRCRARDFFISMPGLTLCVGEKAKYETYMKTAEKAVTGWMNAHLGIEGEEHGAEFYEMEHPDVLLWACLCIQVYVREAGLKACLDKYGALYERIITFLKDGHHPNLFVHDNGLVYANGREKAISWMNSEADGRPIVARSGYLVEFNALWYNALSFYRELLSVAGRYQEATLVGEEVERVGQSFRDVFVNPYGYLYDWVDGPEKDKEVRPNMIFAAALEFSPLTRAQQKQVVDICTRELLTPKGLRSLSPKSGAYTPIYEGVQRARDYAYHRGTAWPWLLGYYLKAYLRIYKMSGVSFVDRQLIGIEEELFFHSIGSIPEMFDGNPPFHGRGADSFAMNVAGILMALRLNTEQIEGRSTLPRESETKERKEAEA